MSLSIFLNSSRWLSKFQKHQYEEFYHIKTPFKLLKKFLNIMVRVYLNKLMEISDKLNVSDHEYTNVDFFNQLFEKICFMKNYFSDCFFIKNDLRDYIDLTI